MQPSCFYKLTTWFTQGTQGHFLQYLALCKQILVGWWEELYGLTFLNSSLPILHFGGARPRGGVLYCHVRLMCMPRIGGQPAMPQARHVLSRAVTCGHMMLCIRSWASCNDHVTSRARLLIAGCMSYCRTPPTACFFGGVYCEPLSLGGEITPHACLDITSSMMETELSPLPGARMGWRVGV